MNYFLRGFLYLSVTKGKAAESINDENFLYVVLQVINLFLFIRGLSCPCCVRTSLTQNCHKLTIPGFPHRPLPDCYSNNASLKKGLGQVLTWDPSSGLSNPTIWAALPPENIGQRNPLSTLFWFCMNVKGIIFNSLLPLMYVHCTMYN